MTSLAANNSRFNLKDTKQAANELLSKQETKRTASRFEDFIMCELFLSDCK